LRGEDEVLETDAGGGARRFPGRLRVRHRQEHTAGFQDAVPDTQRGANYSEAARLLQSGLDQGLGSNDEVKAHKYLAFIHCISGREQRCRDEFRAALKIDPSFELAANEAGHPIWGPAFRSAKGRK
jgi:hypothetical protein